MRLSAVGVLVWAVTAGGCNSLGDARAARGTGATREYEESFDRVWAAIPKAAVDLDLAQAGSFPDERYMLFQRGASMASWGERVAVFVEPVTVARTKVEVVSKRAVSVNVTAKNFQAEMLQKIGEHLITYK